LKGEWCYGKISFVFKKKSRMPQKYRIKYHEGTYGDGESRGRYRNGHRSIGLNITRVR
jgi:hypothetical protein